MMFNTALAFFLSAAAAQPALPPPQPTQGWRVEGSGDGCIAHAAYRGGTVLSIFGLPGHEGIGFLLQNRSWTGLRDGAVYALSIRFDDGSEWPMAAVARLDIDHDGPGLFFAVSPSDEKEGMAFLTRFADAGGMQVSSGEGRIETLALDGSRGATVALARCLSRVVSGQPASSPFDDPAAAATAIRL